MSRHVLTVIAVLLAAVGFYNFGSFMLEINRLGGSASGGYVKDGHYFVGDHGRFNEVPREAWERLRVRENTVLPTHLLAMLGMGYLVIGVIVPSRMGRPSPEAAARVASVMSSGPMIAKASCRANVGQVNVPVAVTCYRSGLVVKPLLIGRRAILTREIVSTRKRDGLFRRGIEIEHAATDIASPIMLGVPEGSPVANAIREITKLPIIPS